MKAPLYATYFALLFSLIISTPVPAARSSRELAPIHSGTMTERRRMLGDNDARYCGVPEKEQLFSIDDLTMSPRPPKVDTHLFLFIQGDVYDIAESDLAEATYRLKVTSPIFDEPWDTGDKFSNLPNVVVRQDNFQYSKYSKPGRNEIIGDTEILGQFVHSATYNYEVEVKLADGRTLFCFEFEYFLEGDLAWYCGLTNAPCD